MYINQLRKQAVNDNSYVAIAKAALIWFDAATKMNACRILSETPQEGAADKVADFFIRICQEERSGLGTIVLASCRVALQAVAEGLETLTARAALEWIFMKS